MPTNYAKDILGNLSKGMRLAWCMISPPFQNAPLHLSLTLHVCVGNSDMRMYIVKAS